MELSSIEVMEVSSMCNKKMELFSIWGICLPMPTPKEFETVPLRLPVPLDDKLTALAKRIGKSKQETMRLCMEIGAKWLESNGYDPTREVEAKPLIDSLHHLLEVATGKLIEQIQARDAAIAVLSGTKGKTRQAKK